MSLCRSMSFALPMPLLSVHLSQVQNTAKAIDAIEKCANRQKTTRTPKRRKLKNMYKKEKTKTMKERKKRHTQTKKHHAEKKDHEIMYTKGGDISRKLHWFQWLGLHWLWVMICQLVFCCFSLIFCFLWFWSCRRQPNFKLPNTPKQETQINSGTRWMLHLLTTGLSFTIPLLNICPKWE